MTQKNNMLNAIRKLDNNSKRLMYYLNDSIKYDKRYVEDYLIFNIDRFCEICDLPKENGIKEAKKLLIDLYGQDEFIALNGKNSKLILWYEVNSTLRKVAIRLDAGLIDSIKKEPIKFILDV